MTKLEFINALGDELMMMPQEEAKKVLEYYLESIDDHMEHGLTEADAIESLGSVAELGRKAMEAYRQENVGLSAPAAPAPEIYVVMDAPSKRKLPVWAILLLIIGCPIWLGIGLGFAGAFLGIYITIWTALVSLLISGVTFFLCGIAGMLFCWFLPITPATTLTRVFLFGCFALLTGFGMVLLPLSLWAILGFCKFHRFCWRKLRGGSRA